MRKLLPEFKQDTEREYIPVVDLYGPLAFPIPPRGLHGKLKELEFKGLSLPPLKVVKGTTTLVVVDVPALKINGKQNREAYLLAHYAHLSSVLCEYVSLSIVEDQENRRALQKYRKPQQVEEYLDDNQLEAEERRV